MSTEEELDRIQVVSKDLKLTKKYGKVARVSIIQRDPFIPNSVEESIREELRKQRVVTANGLAKKHKIRVSSAKRLLKKLEAEGLVKATSKGTRLNVYLPQ